MRWLTADRAGRRTRGAGLVALTALAWGVLVPNDLFWTVMVAAGVSGSAIATAMLIRSRSISTLAPVSASREVERVVVVPVGCGYSGGAGLRPRGART